MRACLVGAYPPVCSDASLRTYWTARGLAERGHQVFVVTGRSAGQPESYLDESDTASYQPAFAASGGAVRVFAAGPGGGHQLDPACAGRVVSASGSRVVAASTDEPYATAGYLAARQAGRPLLIPPSGEDRPVPEHIFHADARPLEPAEIARLATARAAPPDGAPRLASVSFDPALPCVGSYDEAGSSLSARLLLAALSSLRAGGQCTAGGLRGAGELRVNTLLMCDPAQHASLWPVVAASGLAGSTWLLPVLPHWKLAAFIRRCTVICCLGPATATIAAETLACGTCLVLPELSLPWLPAGDQLKDGASAVLVPGWGDGPELAGRLRMLTGRPEAAAQIGASGLLCARKLRTFAQFVDEWEVRLGSMAGSARPQPQPLEPPEPQPQPLEPPEPQPGGARIDQDAELAETRPGRPWQPDLLMEDSVAAAARSCQGPGWLQFGLVAAPGRRLRSPETYAAMHAASTRLLDAGLASDFFFMHKPPGIRLRFRGAAAARPELGDYLQESLAGWERSGLIGGWRTGVYEPEEQLFGGPLSMSSVHRFFTADSLAWLGYHAAGQGTRSPTGKGRPGQATGSPAGLGPAGQVPGSPDEPGPAGQVAGSPDEPGAAGQMAGSAERPEQAAQPAGPAWAMSLLLVRSLLDALQVVGWEDRDVWDRLRRQTGRRLSPAMAARPELTALTAALKPAWSSPAALAALLSPAAGQLAETYRAAVLAEGKRWCSGYLESGDALVGARELAAFMIVFHWNRAGLSMARQALLTEAMLASRPGAAP